EVVNGSTVTSPREPSLRRNAARSRRVTASSAPIDHPVGVRPVSFAAPRIVVLCGWSAYAPPAASTLSGACGGRALPRGTEDPGLDASQPVVRWQRARQHEP